MSHLEAGSTFLAPRHVGSRHYLRPKKLLLIVVYIESDVRKSRTELDGIKRDSYAATRSRGSNFQGNFQGK